MLLLPKSVHGAGGRFVIYTFAMAILILLSLGWYLPAVGIIAMNAGTLMRVKQEYIYSCL